jgi:hypothetical protein
MKSIFTLFLSLFSFAAYTQLVREHSSFLNNVVGNTNGIEGILEAPGQVSYVAEKNFGNEACYSFAKTSGYTVQEKSHYRIPGSLFYPTSIVKMGQYLYITAEYGSSSQKNYGLLKITADLGIPTLFKKIDADTKISPKIKWAQIPNSQELLLSYHTTTSDSTSQIHFFSLNPNLEVTNYKQMISFPTLKNQGYLAIDDTYDFGLDGSNIHYSIVFHDGNESRLETGSLNMANNTIDASYAILSDTIHHKRSKIAQIKNSSIAYMANNSLFIRSTNDSVYTKYSFNIPFLPQVTCFDMKQMPNDNWMALFQTALSPTGYSPVGIFDVDGLIGGINIYYPTPSCSSIVINGNNVMILGTMNKNSTSIHEFQMSNFAHCNTTSTSYTISTSQVNIFESQAAEINMANYSATNLALPTEIEAILFDEPVCNPNHLGLSDSKTSPISVYPNPASDLVHIQTDNETITGISIKTFTGAEVYKSNENSDNHTIAMSIFPAGIYWIEVRTKASSYTQKIIKQ